MLLLVRAVSPVFDRMPISEQSGMPVCLMGTAGGSFDFEVRTFVVPTSLPAWRAVGVKPDRNSKTYAARTCGHKRAEVDFSMHDRMSGWLCC